jgi:MGT family glycosyltransferase
MHLDVPYVQIWNALHMDPTGTTPVFLFDWPYDPTAKGRVRNAEGLRMIRELGAPMRAVGITYAEKVGLKINWSDPFATASKLAVITQTPKEFDFPGIPWPAQFHYTGPFHDSQGRQSVTFPWERMTDKPLIYASLGTLVNGIEVIYQTILQAVENLSDVQLVLSIGSNVQFEDLVPTRPDTIVVRVAPQIELLKHAALCITHAGLNTTLEALSHGVPLVAIPIAFDQPGVAARIAYHGVGEFLNLDSLNPTTLSALILKVRDNPDYKSKALYFQKIIAEHSGLDLAADVLEEALAKVR